MNDAHIDIVIDYVIEQLNNGTTEQILRQELDRKGYPAEYIEKVFSEIYATPGQFLDEKTGSESVAMDLISAAAHTTSKHPEMQGRLGRLGFLTTLLFSYAAVLIPSLIFILIFGLARQFALERSLTILIMLFGIITMLPLSFWAIWIRLYACVRRLHDFNQSGYWALLSLLGVFDMILYITLVAIPGHSESNEYGTTNPTQNPLRIVGLIK